MQFNFACAISYVWKWFLLLISSQNRFFFLLYSMCVVILNLQCLVGTNNIPRLDLPFYNVPWQLLRFMEELESIQLLFSHSKNSLTQQTRVDSGLCCNGFHSWHDSSKKMDQTWAYIQSDALIFFQINHTLKRKKHVHIITIVPPKHWNVGL